MHVQSVSWLLLLGRVLFVSYFVAMGIKPPPQVPGAFRAPRPQSSCRFRGSSTILTVVMMVGGGVLFLFNWHSATRGGFVVRHNLSRSVLSAPLLERDGLVFAAQ